MPTLMEAVQANLSKYIQGSAPVQNMTAPPSVDLQGRYTTMRCPLPPLFQASPDSVRTFDLHGIVPQTRLFTTDLNQSSGTASGGKATVVVSQTGASGGSGAAQISAATSTLTTPVIGPGIAFTATMAIAQSFQLLSAATNGPARLEMYGTSTAQNADMARGLDVPPSAGTAQGILCDVALDTAPYQWSFQNRAGSNGDSPQKPTVYVTVTNLSQASMAITVSVLYVGLES